MYTKRLSLVLVLISAATIFAFAPIVKALEISGNDNSRSQKHDAQVKKEINEKLTIADTSQLFPIDNLPDVVVVNKDIIKSDSFARQPRIRHLKITNIKVGEDGKTISFSINNTFDRKNAKPVRIGGIMLTGQARFDYDGGKKSHNCVLFKEKRLVLQKGDNHFTTDPSNYVHVTKLEKLQFFFLPAKIDNIIHEDTSKMADTSQMFDVDNLPDVIVVDRATVEQNAAKGDPRLAFLRIKDLYLFADKKGPSVEFSVENLFDREDTEPIHLGNLVLTAMARYDYDKGKELHSCILFEDKHVVIRKGINNFKTSADLYPGVAKIESLQFYITP